MKLEFNVTVEVDPKADELIDALTESNGLFSHSDVVLSEITSNLESVGYVKSCTVVPVER